jgi:CHAT domain
VAGLRFDYFQFGIFLWHLGGLWLLVALSACQTALGGSSDGVEISGVSDFFFQQGVKTVVALLGPRDFDWEQPGEHPAVVMRQSVYG